MPKIRRGRRKHACFGTVPKIASRGTVPTARITRIERGAIHDGPGVRTVVFLKGCPLRCLWCHSPETQSMQPEVLLFKERCLACGTCMDVCPSGAISPAAAGGFTLDRTRCTVCGTCTETCPVCVRQIAGEEITADALMQEIVRDRPFFDMSGGGVTLSGGEPLLQPGFVVDILQRCRREGIHTAVETCGLGNHAAAVRVAELADAILFDLKIADPRRHQRATGVSNERIIANLRDMARIHPAIIIRFALIPGMTDDRPNVDGIAALARSAGAATIHVLPYHRAGMAKYERLGRRYWLSEVFPPSAEDIATAVGRFKDCGLNAFAGGLA